MAVFRWGSALEAFRDLEREMDRWLRGIDQASYGPRLGRPFPALNLYELESEFLLVAELPGVQAEDLDVSIAGGSLTIRAKRQASSEVAEDKFRRSERLQGTWERSIALPDRVRDDDIQAELVNGLLKLHLPKVPVTEPRRISVVQSVETGERNTAVQPQANVPPQSNGGGA